MYGLDPEGRRFMKTAGRASAVGIELAVSIVGCLIAGWWADEKLGTSPALTLVGLFLGTFAGFWSLYKTAKAMEQQALDANEEDRKTSGSGDDEQDGP